MRPRRATRPFSHEVRDLLAEQEMSIRELARRSGVNASHLSRLLRGADYQISPSLDVARRVARALELPDDYFAEYRLKWLARELERDAALRDSTYDRIHRALRR